MRNGIFKFVQINMKHLLYIYLIGSKLYTQIVGIQMGTYCASLVANSFLFFYGRDFMLSLDNASLLKCLNQHPDI